MKIRRCKICREPSDISTAELKEAHFQTDRHRANEALQKLKRDNSTGVEQKVVIRAIPKPKSRRGRLIYHAKLHENVVIQLLVENHDKNGPLMLTAITRLCPCPLITLVDQHNLSHGSLGPSATSVIIPSHGFYQITIQANCSANGLLACPIHFRLQKNNEDFSMIRELTLNVSYDGEEMEEMETDEAKSPYQWDIWPLMRRTIPKTMGRNLILIDVPNELKRLLFKDAMKGAAKLPVSDKMYRDKLMHKYKEEGASRINYASYFRDLIYMEIYAVNSLIDKYNMTGVTIKFYNNTWQFYLDVPGLEENRPSVMLQDGVYVCLMIGNCWDDTQYEGEVTSILEKAVVLDYFHDEIKERIYNSYYKLQIPMKLCVRFMPSHYCFKVMISSVETVHQVPHLVEIIFPEKTPSPSNKDPPIINLINKRIENNKEQKTAIANIVAGTSLPAPYIVFGPPGSGKTECLIEAIIQVMLHYPQSRILVCTQSNTACDHLARCLLICLSNNKLINPRLKKIKALRFVAVSHTNSPKNIPHRSDLLFMEGINVVCSTLINAYRLVRIGTQFSHVFIDEAGQAQEPEALAGICTIMKGGQLVLAGDPKQLGPVCMSFVAQDLGLGTSLLDRLIDTVPLYEKIDGVYNDKYISYLRECYRCHPLILELSNRLFYNSELQIKNTPDPLSSYSFETGSLVGGSALIVHGIIGREKTLGKSPSYYNDEEVNEVLSYLSIMLGATFPIPVKKTDIGIISPYARQVAKIQNELKLRGWEAVSVGTVESFQGQERRVTIVSTVRSQHDMLNEDKKFQMGFVKLKRRLNVMLTRAKAKNIVIGNPIVLAMDPEWRDLVVSAMKGGYYTGTPVTLRDQDWVDSLIPMAVN